MSMRFAGGGGGSGPTAPFPMGFNVMAFGAKNDGTNLSATTAAIQAAYDTASSAVNGSAFGGAVYFPPGEYRCGPVVASNSQIETFGAGRGLCKINFVPTGNFNPGGLTAGNPDPGTWLTVANQNGTPFPQEAFYGGVRDIRIATDDLTSQKNAIYSAETSQFCIQRVVVDKFWGNNSAGLRIAGHESMYVRDCYFSGAVPVWIGPGLVAYGGAKYDDFLSFRNVQTRSPHGSDPATYYPDGVASGVPLSNFFIDDGTFISNLTLDNISWVGGANAVYWKQTLSSVSFNYRVAIIRGRKEQAGGTNAPADPKIGFVFDFQTAPQTLNDVTVRGVYVADTSTMSGIYARRVQNLLLDNFQCPAPSASGLYFADVGDVYTMKWINCQSASAGAPAGLNIGANVGSMRKATFRQNCNLPNNAEWTFESAPRVAKTLAAGVNSNLTTVFGVSSDIGGLDFPDGVETIVFDTTAGAATLTGLPILGTGVPYMFGKRIRGMVKNGGNNLNLTHNDAAETTATHRFECPGATTAIKIPGQSWFWEYDTTLSRYVVI